MKKNLWLLAIAQGLFLTNNVVFIAINGLVGLSLAPAGWMATLPGRSRASRCSSCRRSARRSATG